MWKREAQARFRMAVTPHYASLVRHQDFSDPVFAQCVPAPGELLEAPFATLDPLGEKPASPVPRLVRRYGDRAVLLASSDCACYCRHCFRKRVSGGGEPPVSARQLEDVAAWLRRNPEVDDVLVSGGDPLLLSDARVSAVLRVLSSVPGVRVVRIATRTPGTHILRIQVCGNRRAHGEGEQKRNADDWQDRGGDKKDGVHCTSSAGMR